MDIFSLFSRRNLLFGLLGTGLATSGGVMHFRSAHEFSQLVRPRGLGRRRVPLHTAAKDDWSAQVGTVFAVETGHRLKLIDVQGFPEVSERPAGLRESAFVAEFEIERGGPLPGDQILRFSHTEGGTFDMLLSISSDPQRMFAIFN